MNEILANISRQKLKSWEQIHECQRPGWIYRGHRMACWEFETTFERCCNRNAIPSGERMAIERELRREFRRAYHQHASHIPDVGATIEWLSLMQHFGAPTRLLDFTYSIYVAAYFAVEMATEDCAVWAVNSEWAMQRTLEGLRKVGKRNREQLKDLERTFLEKTEAVVEPLFMRPPFARVVCPVNPFRSNERLQTQKGVFLTPGNVEVSFMENLTSMPGYDDPKNLIGYIIPGDRAKDARRSLFTMNITRKSLFPGLEGYAQALGVYHPVFSDDEPIHRSAVQNS